MNNILRLPINPTPCVNRILSPLIWDSCRFNYISASKTFCQEASTLDLPPGADLRSGFYIKSAKTGREVRYLLKQIHVDREGDLTHWEFIPAERDTPADGTKVLIWND